MKSIDQQYIELARNILTSGTVVKGRNNLEYVQLFGQDVTLDLREEFPALTLRKMPMSNLYKEFMWDVSGRSDIESLGSARHFWEFLAIDGWLPASYGSAWRMWPLSEPPTDEDLFRGTYRHCPFDQLKWVYRELKSNPTNRQLVVQTYNPSIKHEVAKCPPCHPSMVFSSDSQVLDLLVLGRSQDMATGLPLDVIRYAMLLQKMAHDANLEPRFLKISIANVHIYYQNLDSIKKVIEREPRGGATMVINPDVDLWSLDPEKDFKLKGYNPHPVVRMEVAK